MHSNDNTHQHSVAVASFFTPSVFCAEMEKGMEAVHCIVLCWNFLHCRILWPQCSLLFCFTVLYHFALYHIIPRTLACVAKWKREELVVNWRREGGWSEKAAELDAQMRNPRIRFWRIQKIRGGGSLVLKGRVSQRQDIGDDVGEDKMMLNFTSWRENWVKWF